MGSACTKSNESQVLQPQSQQDITMHNELAPFMKIDHPFNVNHKYSSFCTYLKNEFCGQGIKRTHAYKTKLTKEELQKKRTEFWDTRVEGYQHCWQILHQAIDTNEKDAMAILAAGGIKLVNRSIQISYDDSFRKYDIPMFCLNDPISFETVPSHEKNINTQFEEIEVKIVIRCAKLDGKDITLTVQNTILLSDLKIKFKESSGKTFSRVRFFIGGRELIDHHKLGSYNIDTDKIINAFAFDQ